MRIALLIGAALAGLASAGAAAELQPFRPDRTAEDYSALRDPAKREAEPAYKFVPLDREGGMFASFGGELRERAELFDAPRFGIGGAREDAYLLQRILVHGDFRFGGQVRVFAQLGAHEAFGKRQLAAPDEDHLDVHQLFLELAPAGGVSLRLGRQEMAFNPAQRFVSFRDGTNVRQAFDGARATLKQGRVRVDAFAVRPVALERGVFDDEPNDAQFFAGGYASLALDGVKGSLDAYWFHLDREDAVFGGAPGEERRDSFGMRFGGTSGGWDWDAEALLQRGRFAGRDISAWAGSIDAGYSLANLSWKPRLGLRFDAGSGDGAGDALGTFNPLFPKGSYFNEANLTSFANLLAVRPSVKLQPAGALTIEAAAQFKWKQERADAVYLGPLAPLPGTRGTASREIGQVYSLDAIWQLGRHWSVRGYYLRHSAGDAIREAGGRPIDFLMGSAQFRF